MLIFSVSLYNIYEILITLLVIALGLLPTAIILYFIYNYFKGLNKNNKALELRINSLENSIKDMEKKL
jgi:competence protein ComGF